MSTIDSSAPAATYGTPATGARNGSGTAALVLGIVAVVLCWSVVGGIVLGILAVIFGIVGRGRANRGEATNRGSATAGIVTGVIGIILAGALIAFGVSILNSTAGKNLQQCLKNANGNKAAASQCEAQYASSH
jgi:hypothetical protein